MSIINNDNKSISTPLLVKNVAHEKEDAPSRRTVGRSSMILGLLVGVLSQRNDYSTHLIGFLYRHLASYPVLLSGLYAAATTLELLVFLCLLRLTVGSEQGRLEVDRSFGKGAIVGVSIAWVGVSPGSEIAILGVTCVSLVCFQFLLWLSGALSEEEKEETKTEVAEYQLLIV